MTKISLEEQKQWYLKEVIKEFQRRRYTELEIQLLFKVSNFKENLEKYPEYQLHYMPYDAVDEILEIAQKEVG